MILMTLSDNEFFYIKKYIEEICGISLGDDKAYLVETRLSRLLEETGICDFGSLCSMISSRSIPDKLSRKIVDAITTNETLWFRDITPWIVLKDRLMPEYIDDLRSGRKKRIRIWSAGCSTGQEPYSIAMNIDSYLELNGIRDISLNDFEIAATDISSPALAAAEAGVYDSIAISRGLPELYRNIYFKSDSKSWRLDKKIRSAVSFRWFNLQDSFVLYERMDAIFCRYVLIYFSNKLKNSILEKLAKSLNHRGKLFLGSSELHPEYGANFEMENYRGGIYYEVKSTKEGIHY